MTQVRSAPTPWLFGPWPDLLFGCGLWYTLAFGVFLVVGDGIRSSQPELLFPLLILAISVPHYGATILRVYERRRERRAYVVFSLWVTLVIAALFLASLRLPVLASLLVTLYLTWSPWHYTGQNYGISVMFLRRGGVALEPGLKRWLHASFLLSYLIVFLQMHTDRAGMSDLPVGYTSEQGAVFVPLGIPTQWALALATPLSLAYLAALVVLAVRLRGRTPWRALVAAGLLSLSQLLWFSLPYALHLFGVAPKLDPLDWTFRRHYFTWIAAAHVLQYLWVTSYYAQQSGAWHGHARFYGKALLAGAAPWTLPFLLLGPPLGPLSADAGLAILVASAVNIHHFVLDGAIWKLRGRIAEVLIRSGADVEDVARPQRRFGLRHALWAACALALLLNAFQLANEEIYRRSFARGDLRAARQASERLARAGFDRGSVHLALGQALLREGRPAEARDQIWRSLELAPTASAQVALGRSFESERLWERAADAYETALAAGLPREEALRTLAHAADAWLSAQHPERALALLERAPRDDPRFQELSERAQRASDGAVPDS